MNDPAGNVIEAFLRYIKNMGWIRMDVDVFLQRVRNIIGFALVFSVIALLLFNWINNLLSP